MTAGIGTVASVSLSGPRARSGQQLVRLSGLREVVGLDDHERLAPQGLRDHRDRREVQEPSDGRQVVGRIGVRQVAPGGQDLAGALDRVPEQARVRLGDREELQLDRRDNAEAAAAAAQRSEDVRLVGRVGAHEAPVGGHELDRAHVIGRRALLAAEEAEPPAERVADHAHVG